MFRKLRTNRYSLFLILSIFCFSSATLGGFLLYGQEVHFVHNNAHTHHTDGDHDLGESDHADSSIILYLDFLASNSSRCIKTSNTPNQFLCYYLPPDYFNDFSNCISRIPHRSNINKLLSTDLYQLHSSYLI